MKSVCDGNGWVQRIAAFALIMQLFGWTDAEEAQAQRFQIKWLNVGDYQSYYSEGGVEPRRNPRQGLQWPAIMPEAHHFVRKGMWIAVTDWEDPQGEQWEHKIAHVGPRVQGEDEVFPVEFKLVSRFEAPEVTVDGFQSFDKAVFIDEIDPTLKADRMIYTLLNTLQGITVERRVYAFGQEFHDDYHVWEYVLTNSGNVDEDEEIELPDQTLTGLYAGFLNKYTVNTGAHPVIGNGVLWGKNLITDVVGDGMENYDVDFRAMYSWHGRIPEFTKYNNIGAPAWSDDSSSLVEGDSVGRLTAANFIGRVFLHEDQSATDKSDHPDQPSTMITYDSGRMTNNDAWNEAQMAEEYDQRLAVGIEYPHHADQIVAPAGGLTWRERFARQEQNASKGINAGIMPMHAYGPYTLAPGESIRIVFAEGINGLSTEASIEVGKAYKQSGGDDALLIEFDANGDGVIGAAEVMTKNEWVMTSRDSIFQTFRRARANLEAGFEIPQPPLPPRALRVTSGTDQILLEWDTFADAQQAGWEIYRGRHQYQGAVEDDFQYELIAELGPNSTSYEDEEVQRGISYYYYVQAFGEENNDPTGQTPTGVRLRSSRYYAQTYDPAVLKRAPGQALENARVVPNPYNLAAAKELRWPDQQDKLAFLEIPGKCTIKIYTERGDLVETVEHTDGSGDAYWDLTTSSNQVVVSGLYIAVISDHETGDQIAKKFFVIR